MTTPLASPVASGGGTTSLTGVRTLVRFLLRRDRIRLPAWAAGLGLFVVYIGAALPQIAPTPADLASVTTIFTQPVGRMFTGPAFGMDAPTYDRFFAAGYAPYLFLLAALMNVLLVVRHTRAEEQAGRAELVRASVTGRYAALTACLVVAVISDVVVAVVVTAVAVGVGFAPAGSLLIGLGTALTGIAFAGIAAVAAQLTEYSRAAVGIAGAVLGGSFAIRAVGDMAATGGSALSWVSPLGWAPQTAPYVHDRWWPLLPLAALAVGAIAVGYALQGRRDLGAGLIAARPGAVHAHPSLGTPLGLAVRLQRGACYGWGAGILLLGVVDGAFTQALIDAGDRMPAALREMFGTQGLLDGYVAYLGSFVGVLIAAYVVFAMQTLRGEERAGRADAVLATPVGRATWLATQAAVVGLAASAVCVVTGVGTGLAAAGVTGRWALVADVLAAHVGYLPAILVVLAVCAALYGWVPRLLAPLGWALAALTMVVAFFGDLLDVPGWIAGLSPFRHLAQLPVEDFAPAPFVGLIALAAAGLVAGLAGFRRRQVRLV